MVVIRLARTGKKKQAFYRVVVADSKRAVTAKFISIVGWYNPHTKEVNLKEEELKNWLEKGARPSNTVAVLLKNAGIKLPNWVEIKEKVKKAKKEETPKPETEEKPAEEPQEDEQEQVESNEKTSETGTEAPAEEPAEEAASDADAEVSAE